MRYKIVVEYCGTNFVGWQSQSNGLAVQDVLEHAILKLTGENVRITGSGRTDRGVHALNQVGHFDLKREFKITAHGINFYLHQQTYEVHVKDCKMVDKSFHARASALERAYIYKILISKTDSPIYRNCFLINKNDLDLVAMQDAAQCLVGTHDFSSFRASSCQARSPIKTIKQLKIYCVNCDQSVVTNGESNSYEIDKEINIFITANAFLHHMVRNIVTALIYVGEGKMTSLELKSILESRDRTCAPATAKAHGLYFYNVKY